MVSPTIIGVSLITVLSLLLAACSPAVPNTEVPKGAYTTVSGSDVRNLVEPRAFDTQEELRAFIKSNEGGSGDYYGSIGGGTLQQRALESAPVMMSDSSKSAGSSGAPSFSTTNNQVASVDEADIIKTDGEFIYTLSGNTVFILKAYPGADAQIVSQIDLEQQPSGIFIEDNKLAVFGNFYDTKYFKQLDIRPRNGMTFFTIYDVSDKTKPVVNKEFKFEGNYFQARMTHGYVYFVLTSSLNLAYPTPMVIDGTSVGSVPVRDVYYFPIPYHNVQYATVHAINLESPSISSKSVAIEGANTLYMSEENLFLAYTKYINEWELRQEILEDLVEPELGAADQALIAKIKASDDEVLSRAEKESKISQIYNEYVQYLPSDEQQELNDEIDELLSKKLEEFDSWEYTVITKLSVDKNKIALVATGQVPGHVNNQFALDEHKGTLRIATTENARWSSWIKPMMAEDVAVESTEASAEVAVADSMPIDGDSKRFAPDTFPSQSQSTNNVYTLDEDLKILDKLEKIAPGETIFSTRFIGDRLYMVTFRQIDPFFVVDLSNPSDIKMLGKLKVPGFSRYLHPYDDNVIIGIGRDATSTGRQEGLKISLFDVSDPEKPKELAKWTASDDYSQSSAEYEHKAFLFDKDKELLVIPGYSYDWSKGAGQQNYNGAMVFKITAKQIEMRGIIDHGTTQQYWAPMVERSLWINELLYTKSPTLLRINKIDDLSSVKKISLVGKNVGPYPVY